MKRKIPGRVVVALVAASVLCLSVAAAAEAAGQFTTLASPFTQALYGVQSSFFSGGAFALTGPRLSVHHE